MKLFILILFTLLLGACADGDTPIKKKLLLESRANYSGNCACPYSLDKAGKRCDENSEHSKTGGKYPLCYENDVTTEMVQAYKNRNQ